MSSVAPDLVYSVVPVLRVREVTAAIGIFELLDFRTTWSQGEPPVYVALARGNCLIRLEEQLDALPHMNAIYIQTNDVECEWRRCRERGLRLIEPIADRPTGTREFSIEGPEKIQIQFGQVL